MVPLLQLELFVFTICETIKYNVIYSNFITVAVIATHEM